MSAANPNNVQRYVPSVGVRCAHPNLQLLLAIAYASAAGTRIETIAYAYDANGQRTSSTRRSG